LPITSLETWKTYLTGEFRIVLLALLSGGVVGGISAYASKYVPDPHAVNQVRQFQLDATTRTLHEENVASYGRIIIFARVERPDGSAAKLTIFQSSPGQVSLASPPLNVSTGTWARVDIVNDHPTLGLMVEPPEGGGMTPATQVSVFTYLSTR